MVRKIKKRNKNLAFFVEKNYASAREHIIHTEDGSVCATFLIEHHVMLGFPGEMDLFVSQAVLQ